MLEFYAIDNSGRVKASAFSSESYLGGIEFEEYQDPTPRWQHLRRAGVNADPMLDFAPSQSQLLTAITVIDGLRQEGWGTEPGWEKVRGMFVAAAKRGLGVCTLSD